MIGRTVATRIGLAIAATTMAAGMTLGKAAEAVADITPNHDDIVSTNACEDILLGWSDGQIIDNLVSRYRVSSRQALEVVTEMRIPGNCEFDADF